MNNSSDKIIVICDTCGARIKANIKTAGTTGTCPRCNSLIIIPKSKEFLTNDIYDLVDPDKHQKAKKHSVLSEGITKSSINKSSEKYGRQVSNKNDSLRVEGTTVYLDCSCGNSINITPENISDSVLCPKCRVYQSVAVTKVFSIYRRNAEERIQDKQRKYEQREDERFRRRYNKKDIGDSPSSDGSNRMLHVLLGVVGIIVGLCTVSIFQGYQIDDLNRRANIENDNLNRAMDRFADNSSADNKVPIIAFSNNTQKSQGKTATDLIVNNTANRFEVFGITLGDIATPQFVGTRVYRTLDNKEIPITSHPRVLLNLKSFLLVSKDIEPFTNDPKQPYGAIVYVGPKTNKIIGMSLQRIYENGKTEIVEGQGFRVVEEKGIKYYEDFLKDWNPIVRGMIQKYGVSSKKVDRPSHTAFGIPDSGTMLEWNKGYAKISITDVKNDIGIFMQIVYYDSNLLGEENRLMAEEDARITESLSPSRKEF